MIKNSDISKNAKIDPSKIAPAPKEGEILLSQENGKFAPVKLSGDVSVNKNGIVRIKNIDGVTKEIQNYRDELNAQRGGHDALTKSDLKEGKTLVGGATGPEEIAVGSGSGAIPQRDSSGNLKAETADQATNADNATNSAKLNNQAASFYTDVTNHTGQAAAYEYEATSQSNVSQSPSTFTHNLGYIPDVTVYQSDGQDPPSFSEIDAEVKSTTTSTDVTVSEGGVSMKVIIK